MTAKEARAQAAARGWTLVKRDDLFHVFAGALPIGAGPTQAAAVQSAAENRA